MFPFNLPDELNDLEPEVLRNVLLRRLLEYKHQAVNWLAQVETLRRLDNAQEQEVAQAKFAADQSLACVRITQDMLDELTVQVQLTPTGAIMTYKKEDHDY